MEYEIEIKTEEGLRIKITVKAENMIEALRETRGKLGEKIQIIKITKY